MRFGDFEIIIRSTTSAGQEVLANPGKWNVVSIRNPGQDRLVVDQHGLAKRMVKRFFHDLRKGQDEYGILPRMKDVEAMLSWSIDKNPILVHCQGGISRSAATAYLIACTRVSPQIALYVLNPMRHWPNQFIIELGAKHLGKPEIEEVISHWKEMVMKEEMSSDEISSGDNSRESH